MFVFSCLVYIGIHPKLSLSLNLWSVNVCFNSQVILTCVSEAQVWCYSPNTCSNLLHSQKEMLAQRQFFITDGQLILLGGKHWKYASSGFQLKWSLILLALMKKNFCLLSVEEVALTVSAKPSVTLKALCPDGALPLAVSLPGSGLTPVSVICLLSPREGNTITRGGICSWNRLGAHLVGSRARLSRAQWGRLGWSWFVGFL